MKTTNYYNAFIEVAEDCPVNQAEIPVQKGAEKTAVIHQFEFIKNNPYHYSSDDVLFGIHVLKNNIPEGDMETEKAKFFSKGQACFRASPLAKRYGWGIHSNAEGKVAIYARESEDYQKLAADPDLQHVKAMRSKR